MSTTEDIKEVMKWSDVKMVEIYDDSSSEERIQNVFTKLEKRQKKLEQCEKIIMLTDTFKLLNELHFFDSNEEEKT